MGTLPKTLTWRQRNPEKAKEVARRYQQKAYWANPEEFRRRSREWQRAHPRVWKRLGEAKERHRIYMKKWHAKHAAHDRAYRRKHYLRTRQYQFKKSVRWRAENPTRWRRYMQEYRKRNKSKLQKQVAAWRAKHKSWIKRSYKIWMRGNRDRINAIHQRRRAAIAQASGSHSAAEWLKRLKYYRYRCFYCGKRLSRLTATKDHATPLTRGGSNFIANIVPACGSCNSRKRTKTALEFLEVLAQERCA